MGSAEVSILPVTTKAVPTGHGERQSLREKGAMWVANQAHRVSMRVVLNELIERLRRGHQFKLLERVGD